MQLQYMNMSTQYSFGRATNDLCIINFFFEANYFGKIVGRFSAKIPKTDRQPDHPADEQTDSNSIPASVVMVRSLGLGSIGSTK